MTTGVNNYRDFERLVVELWGRTPVFALVLHDSRESHKPIASFLKRCARWLDELAEQSGVYILFPLEEEGGDFANPSPKIAKQFGLSSKRLPGIILLATGEKPGDLGSSHFLFVPLSATDFSDLEGMQATLSDIFSLVQEALAEGQRGHAALEEIRRRLSQRRRRKARLSLVQNLRKGAQIVLIKLPEKFLSAFAEGLGKALGTGVFS